MRINFDLLDMRAFLAVSELRSFHGAAEVLGLLVCPLRSGPP
jgi:hypothetical protein